MVSNRLIKGVKVKDNPKLLGIFLRPHKDGGCNLIRLWHLRFNNTLGQKRFNLIINGQLLFGGELIVSWACRVDNEKHNLSYVKPAFSPPPVRLRHFINFFPRSSPNSSVDMGVDKLYRALNWALRSGLNSSRRLRFSSLFPDKINTKA